MKLYLWRDSRIGDIKYLYYHMKPSWIPWIIFKPNIKFHGGGSASYNSFGYPETSEYDRYWKKL